LRRYQLHPASATTQCPTDITDAHSPLKKKKEKKEKERKKYCADKLYTIHKDALWRTGDHMPAVNA
jgi:hypothetical protein